MGLSKKSGFFKWEQATFPTSKFTRQEDWEYIWQQIKVDRCNVDYDSFRNEWDLMVLFNCRHRNPGWRWQFQ